MARDKSEPVCHARYNCYIFEGLLRKPAVASARSLRLFCEALHEETGGRSRWTTIVAVAKRMDMDVRKVILLAADCAAAGLVRLDIKGPPYRLLPSSAILTDEGWALITKAPRTSAKDATKARKRRQ
jgi:hypothetical protein